MRIFYSKIDLFSRRYLVQNKVPRTFQCITYKIRCFNPVTKKMQIYKVYNISIFDAFDRVSKLFSIGSENYMHSIDFRDSYILYIYYIALMQSMLIILYIYYKIECERNFSRINVIELRYIYQTVPRYRERLCSNFLPQPVAKPAFLFLPWIPRQSGQNRRRRANYYFIIRIIITIYELQNYIQDFDECIEFHFQPLLAKLLFLLCYFAQ